MYLLLLSLHSFCHYELRITNSYYNFSFFLILEDSLGTVAKCEDRLFSLALLCGVEAIVHEQDPAQEGQEESRNPPPDTVCSVYTVYLSMSFHFLQAEHM